MIWGLFPGEETVSWETHLFASLTGAFFGFVDARMSDRPDLEDAADPEERRRLI
jgi:membrane associated rhomboid family serine protease